MAETWIGQWDVTDGDGSSFTITLNGNGSATSTWENGEEGTWTDGGDHAVVSWTNGWTDRLEAHDGGYRKVATAPGGSEPDNTSGAVRRG